MYRPRYEPEAIEKIRKPQWTVENTRNTQEVVDLLEKYAAALDQLGISMPAGAMRFAITRFRQLDPKVK